jgi:hypothetical protein
MFDIARLTDMVGGVLGQGATDAGAEMLMQQLNGVGIDAAQLDGLAPAELLSQLSEQGIDLSQMDAAEISKLTEQLGIDLPIEELFSQLTNQPNS